MNFRLTGPGSEEVKWLWDYCFEKRNHPFFQWYFSSYCQESNVLAGYINGNMAACLHLNPYEIFLRGQALPVSYIVGLGVAPDARGGCAGELLRGALEEMKRRNHWVSIIMPARAGTYYPYQWELYCHQLRYSVVTADLRAVGLKWGSFSLCNRQQDLSKLDSVYRRFVANKHGYAQRSQAHWTAITEEHTLDNGYIYILENANQAEGYIFYKLDQGKILVREMAYTCRQALLSLVRFLYQHSSQAKTAEWNAPMDDWLHFLLNDPKNAVTLEPFMAARIVDAEQTLAALSYPEDCHGTVALEIEDNLAPWNNRYLSLTVSDGQGSVSLLADKPDNIVSCRIGALTQLVFGRLSAFELMEMGRIHTSELRALTLLNRLFPKCSNYINEYY